MHNQTNSEFPKIAEKTEIPIIYLLIYKPMEKEKKDKIKYVSIWMYKQLEEENKRLRKTAVMQEMEYNQLLKSYNRITKELEEAKSNRNPFTIFRK